MGLPLDLSLCPDPLLAMVLGKLMNQLHNLPQNQLTHLLLHATGSLTLPARPTIDRQEL